MTDSRGMTVTIEVASEADGASTTRRTYLISGDYRNPGELEKAALDFIRSARAANEELLQNHGGLVAEGETS